MLTAQKTPLFVILLGIGSLTVALIRARRSGIAQKRRTLIDYLLVWPLILDLERRRDPARAARLFTLRELIGWALVLALIGVILAVGEH